MLKPRFHSRYQLLLCHVLLLQGRHDIFIHGVLGDDVMNGHHIGLPLTPEARLGLLLPLQRPCQPKPDQDVPALLDVEAVTR